ncbi:Uncharacterised protein [Klebsiella quasivariicola]|nr:Uncharacterised protein [Klebsiella quasivariicola]
MKIILQIVSRIYHFLTCAFSAHLQNQTDTPCDVLTME